MFILCNKISATQTVRQAPFKKHYPPIHFYINLLKKTFQLHLLI